MAWGKRSTSQDDITNQPGKKKNTVAVRKQGKKFYNEAHA